MSNELPFGTVILLSNLLSEDLAVLLSAAAVLVIGCWAFSLMLMRVYMYNDFSKVHTYFAVHLTELHGVVWPMIKVKIFATLEFTMTTQITKIAEAILVGCSVVPLLNAAI